MGYKRSDDGVRGALIAYDAQSGKEAWRFWSVPGRSVESVRNEGAGNGGEDVVREGFMKIGGGDVWNAITYDETTGLVIFVRLGRAWIMASCLTLR